MLVAISTYTQPLNIVDQYRQIHHAYLKPLFANDLLLVAGRKNTEKGGVIIAKDISYQAFKEILDNDPFVINGVTQYEIIEFTPSFYHADFSL